jgi:hypothetical protein
MSEEQQAEEEGTDFSHDVEIQFGDAGPEVLEKLRPVCTLADQIYNQVLGLIKEMKAAEVVLEKFHKPDSGVTSEDLEKAKADFHDFKSSYMELGNQINDGMRQAHITARTYPEDLLVQNVYKTYLAKLLASLETRNPIQNFVELIAVGSFDLERRSISLTGDEDSHAAEQFEKKELANTEHQIVMLECRYQKRQLANRLRQGENPKNIIMRLVHLAHRDPEDVNTYIWMASLLSDQLKAERNQNERIHVRDEVLDNCKKAFSAIDDYMNLQGMQSLNDRDRMRAEYVKTITSIRRPLLESS